MNKFPKEIATTLEDLMRLEYMVSNLNLLPKQSVHSVLAGKHSSKLRGRGLDFSEVRKYVFGDDIRNIDWKVTAKTKQTHTKVFNEEKERPSFFIVDQSSSMFFASQGSLKSVIAAKVTAIGGFKVLKSGDRIGGLVFNDEGFEIIQPRRSRKNLMHLLKTVASKNQQLVARKTMTTKHDLMNKVLFKAKNMITHDYVVVVVSDFKNINELGFQYLTSIAQHNDIIAIIINDAMETKLPQVKLPVSNGEYQLIINNKSTTHQKYTQSTINQHNYTTSYLRKYEIPYLELNTKDSINEQLSKAFGK